jgi:hypothetical protein
MAVTQYETFKALNQLASVLVGRDRAVETNDLEKDPIQRIKRLKTLVDSDFQQANELGDGKTLKQVARTMESLQSLLVLSELASEVEW